MVFGFLKKVSKGIGKAIGFGQKVVKKGLDIGGKVASTVGKIGRGVDKGLDALSGVPVIGNVAFAARQGLKPALGVIEQGEEGLEQLSRNVDVANRVLDPVKAGLNKAGSKGGIIDQAERGVNKAFASR